MFKDIHGCCKFSIKPSHRGALLLGGREGEVRLINFLPLKREGLLERGGGFFDWGAIFRSSWNWSCFKLGFKSVEICCILNYICMDKGYHLSIEGMQKWYLFCQKRYKREGSWTSGQCLPVQNFVESPSPLVMMRNMINNNVEFDHCEAMINPIKYCQLHQIFKHGHNRDKKHVIIGCQTWRVLPQTFEVWQPLKQTVVPKVSCVHGFDQRVSLKTGISLFSTFSHISCSEIILNI